MLFVPDGKSSGMSKLGGEKGTVNKQSNKKN